MGLPSLVTIRSLAFRAMS
jgi:hypothetical protein